MLKVAWKCAVYKMQRGHHCVTADPGWKVKVKHPRTMWQMVAKERAEAGLGLWDQVACFGNTDSGDSTKLWITRRGGGHRENTKHFLITVVNTLTSTTGNMTGWDYISVHLKHIEKAIIFMVNALPYLRKKKMKTEKKLLFGAISLLLSIGFKQK